MRPCKSTTGLSINQYSYDYYYVPDAFNLINTYAKISHYRLAKRSVHIGNLDPAAEVFNYDADFDIRNLINLDEVMEEYGYGPNGGLVYCMEHLYSNSEWLRDEIDQAGEDEYFILDCPGQIELYSHLPVMRNLAQLLVSWGYRVISVYLLDALFVMEPAKFVSGCMLSLSCMIHLELPHLNVITKCDIADKDFIEKVIEAEGAQMILNMDRSLAGRKMKKFTSAIGSVIDDFMLVSFAMLDVSQEESIDQLVERTDHIIQYGKLSLKLYVIIYH